MMRLVWLLWLHAGLVPIWGQSSLTPVNVASVSVKSRTETALTLEWPRVNNVTYTLRYVNGSEIPLSVSMEGSVVTCTLSSLSPGTRYSFGLYTVLKGARSSGLSFIAVTTPSNVASVALKARSETALTLEWNKVGSNNAYTYILRQNNQTEVYAPMYWGGSVVTHTVLSLSPGTKYSFTLYTVFGGERSSGYNFSAVTLPINIARVDVMQRSENWLVLSWEKVNSNLSYILRHRNGTETPITELDKSSTMTYVVTSLSPGTKYSFTLYTVFEGVKSRGLNFSSVTASVTVTGVQCEYLFGGHGLVLLWDAPGGVWTGVEVQIKGRSPQYSNGTRLEIYDLRPAHWYNVTLRLYLGNGRSAPASISCQADPRGVIAGAVLAVLFIMFLVCLGVYLNCRQSALNRKMQRTRPTDPSPVQGPEEGEHGAPSQAKPRPSALKTYFTSGRPC